MPEATVAAWRTGVEREVPPDELFEKLKPLKDRIAEDIRPGDGDEDE